VVALELPAAPRLAVAGEAVRRSGIASGQGETRERCSTSWICLAREALSEAEAIRLAKQLAEENGWRWLDPAYATLRRRWFGPGGRWEILSNAAGMGPKVRVILDAQSGQVLEKGYIPR